MTDDVVLTAFDPVTITADVNDVVVVTADNSVIPVQIEGTGPQGIQGIQGIQGVPGAIVSGTVMLFAQASPPTGWTQITTHNDKALRIVSGTPSSGGSVAFSTVFGRTQVDGTALSVAQMPAHAHAITDPTHAHTVYGTAASTYGAAAVAAAADPNANFVYDNNSALSSGSSLSGTGISIQNTGSGASHVHTIDLRVLYVDVMLASKN